MVEGTYEIIMKKNYRQITMHSLTFVFLWSLDQIPNHVSLYFQVEILFQSKHQRQNLLHVPFLHSSTKKLYEYIVLWKRIKNILILMQSTLTCTGRENLIVR
jgi:hypothetical protein